MEQLKCPSCGCDDTAITVQYRKSTIIRILKFIFIIAIFLTVVLNMAEVVQYNELGNNSALSVVTTQITISDKTSPDNIPDGYVTINPTGPIILALTVALVFCEFLLQYIESKKCICCVCKKCGKIWHINENID